MSAASMPWRQYICRACGLIYDEEQGDADSGLAPGTRFEDIPDDWACPLCGVVKADFEPYAPSTAPADAVAARTPAPTPHGDGGVVIVGAGIAGWAAAEAVRALSPTLPITIVTACRGDRYHKPELSIAMSRGLSAAALVRETGADAARRLGIRLMAETFVVGLSPSLHRLRTTRGTLRYRHLVLAQGARPALPPSLPATLCWRVNDLDGWTGLRERLADVPRHVAIVGAGMVGCELAEDFARAGHTVTLMDVQAHPLAAILPPPAGERLRDALAALGVGFLGGARVDAVSLLPTGQKRIALAGGTALDVDEVVAATGLVTDSRLARGAGLAFERGIVVNRHTLRTSTDDVYALGDCISVDGAPCRYIEPIARQASVIAHAICGWSGTCYDYRHAVPVIRLKTRALPIVVHGMPCADGRWDVMDDGDGYLRMRQTRDGEPVSTLEAGVPRQRLVA